MELETQKPLRSLELEKFVENFMLQHGETLTIKEGQSSTGERILKVVFENKLLFENMGRSIQRDAVVLYGVPTDVEFTYE